MSAFFSGSLNPFWPHVVLLSVAILGSAAVAVGIVMESPKWSIPNALVIGGVVVEAICTILLFAFDEGISNALQFRIEAQQSKIIALEKRLAPRSILDDQKPELIAKLKPFAGTEFDTATNLHDNEQLQLLASLMDVLTKADWKQVDWMYSAGGIMYKLGTGAGSPNIGEAASFDVEIQVRKESLDRFKDAAEALVGGLKGIEIAAHAVASDETTINNANVQALHLIVGQKR